MTTDLAMETDIDAVVDAAGVLIDLFGLGDRAEAYDEWPIDDGDRVLSAHVTGDADFIVYLAVNEEVSQRLLHDRARLASGLAEAARVVVGADANLEIDEVEMTTDAPQAFAALFDGHQMCALFGVTDSTGIGSASGPAGDVADEAAGAAGAATAGASPFEPAMLQGGIDGFAVNAGPLELLHDVEMEVTVELGRTRLPIRELLTLQPGMVVEIDRAAGAPIDVLVNGRRIASGEVVVVDEEFGVRIVEIVSANEV